MPINSLTSHLVRIGKTSLFNWSQGWRSLTESPASRRSRYYWRLIIGTLSLILLTLDFVTGPFIFFPNTFVLPVCLAVWYLDGLSGIGLAIVLSSSRFVFALIWAHPSYTAANGAVNASIRLIILVGLAMVVNRLRRTELARKRLLNELTTLNTNLERLVQLRTSELQLANLQMQAEIAERQQAETEIRRLSMTDELTGVLNRRGFFWLAEQHLVVVKQLGLFCALLFLDLDELKQTNDRLGHEAGNRMLIHAAQVLKSAVRESDIVARLGGDEFVVLVTLPHQPEQSEVLIDRIKAEVEKRNQSESSPPLSLSIGLVICESQEARTLDELLAAADMMMYADKQRKRCGEPPF